MSLHYPRALIELMEAEVSLDLFFAGLKMHYVKCLADGRIEDWRKCGHALIDYVSLMPGVEKPIRRAEIPPPPQKEGK